jgi:tetratricopeptide (TPR) repeat protein
VTENNYFLMNLLCRHYIDKTPTENAERRCTELLDNTSNYFPAHNTIGLLRVELGRYDDAIASYKRALQVDPTAAIVHANMAVAYARKGDTDEAENQLRKAIDIGDPHLSRDALANSYNELGEAYAKKGETIKARVSFEAALRYHPGLDSAAQNIRKLQQGDQTK